MKKVLILVATAKKRESHLDPLVSEYYQRKEPLSEIYTDSLDNLVFLISNTKTDIFDRYNNSIKTYDLVVFRTIGKNHQEATAVIEYCKKHKVPFTDAAIEDLCIADDENKLAQMMRLSCQKISIPTTFYGPSEAMFSQKHIAYPYVLKAIDGHRGQNNFLVHDQKELKTYLKPDENTKYIIQEFIPNDEDYRVLIAKPNNIVVTLRRRKNTNTHLNNVSQGAEEIHLEESSCPPAVLKIAKKAADATRLSLAGVDVVVDKNTETPYIIEVNRAPQLTLPAEKAAFFNLIDTHQPKNLKIIGRSVLLKSEYFHTSVPARIDTGARTSSIWASDIFIDQENRLNFCLFDKTSELYDGKVFKHDDYGVAIVRNSTGKEEIRYQTTIPIILAGKKIKATFVLSNRINNSFPVLIGRKTIYGKFIVDPNQISSPRLKDRDKDIREIKIGQELKKNPLEFHQKYAKTIIGAKK